MLESRCMISTRCAARLTRSIGPRSSGVPSAEAASDRGREEDSEDGAGASFKDESFWMLAINGHLLVSRHLVCRYAETHTGVVVGNSFC